MIILVAIGTGLFKGNLSGINGLLFNDERELNEAFSIQYSFINVGSFTGTTFIVLLIATWGFNLVFLLCAVLMFVDAIWFICNMRSLGDAGKKPFKVDQRNFNTVATTKEEKANEEKNKLLTSGDRSELLQLFW